MLSSTCNPQTLIAYAGEASAFEDFQEAIEPSSAIIVRHPEDGEAAAAEGDAVQENDATELQPLACPTDLSPKAIALADDHAWSAGLACAQDPELALKLVSRPEEHRHACWYTSRQVLLAVGGYGLVRVCSCRILLFSVSCDLTLLLPVPCSSFDQPRAA